MLSLIMDSGAKVSTMSEAEHQAHFSEFPPATLDKKLCNFDDTQINLDGKLYLPVRYNSEVLDIFRFYVTKRGSSLMSLDLFGVLR